jgi:acyl dehydratase
MPLNYQQILAFEPIETRQIFSARDTILYAFGIGLGRAAVIDPIARRFVYEGGLQTLPTMCSVLASAGFWLKDPKYEIDWRQVLHGEQSIELHMPLPVEGDVTARQRIDAVDDKGAGKAAVIYTVTELRDTTRGTLLATCRRSMFARGAGGFDGPSATPLTHGFDAATRAADVVVELATRPEQALIYRLSGDYNPLHADPAVAAAAGFPAPILHGLATYGIGGWAAVRTLCDGDPTRLVRYDARFAGPVYPGETLRVEFWRQAPSRATMRMTVVERDAPALVNGLLVYRA